MHLEATITPKYVNPPKDGKKNGSIKTADDVFYLCPADLLDKFERGVDITIKYEDVTYGGKPYKQIRDIAAGGVTPPPKPQTIDEKSCDMFVMAVLGKLYEGTGQLPAREVLVNQVADLRYAWNQPKSGEQNLSAPQPPVTQPDGVPF